MLNYEEVVEEVCSTTEVNKSDIFYYSGTPLENECDELFQFFQAYLNDQFHLYDISPARFYFNNDTRVNGSAWFNKGYYLISVNIGTVEKLKSIFLDNLSILNDDNSFKEYRKLEDSLGFPIMKLMYQISTLFFFFMKLVI